jgi:hypothetical protein
VPVDPVTDAWRRRIEALLAKAASTPFGPEAEALIAKAHQLMVRHSISEAALDAGSEEITSWPVFIGPPYANAKSTLLGAVAHANGCRVVLFTTGRGPQRGVVIGRETDRHNTLTMYSWLSIHATEALTTAAVPAGDTPRRFRHAFLLAFAVRIGERLRRETDDFGRSGSYGSSNLVLKSRTDAVDEFTAERYPMLSRLTRTATSAAGVRSGRQAADRAGLEDGLEGSAHAELPAAP